MFDIYDAYEAAKTKAGTDELEQVEMAAFKLQLDVKHEIEKLRRRHKALQRIIGDKGMHPGILDGPF